MSEQNPNDPDGPLILEYASPQRNNRFNWIPFNILGILGLIASGIAVLCLGRFALFYSFTFYDERHLVLMALGGLALGQIDLGWNRNPSKWRRRRAITTIILGLFGLCLSVVYAAFFMSHGGGSAKRLAERNECKSNLQQIGVAIAQYAQKNGGRFPNKLSDLYWDGSVTAAQFVCPSCNDTVATGQTTQAIATAIDKKNHNSYIYIGAGMTTSMVKEDTVIAYELLENHDEDGMNVLYAGGHVDWFTRGTGPAYLLSELKAGHNPPRWDRFSPTTQPAK